MEGKAWFQKKKKHRLERGAVSYQRFHCNWWQPMKTTGALWFLSTSLTGLSLWIPYHISYTYANQHAEALVCLYHRLTHPVELATGEVFFCSLHLHSQQKQPPPPQSTETASTTIVYRHHLHHHSLQKQPPPPQSTETASTTTVYRHNLHHHSLQTPPPPPQSTETTSTTTVYRHNLHHHSLHKQPPPP